MNKFSFQGFSITMFFPSRCLQCAEENEWSLWLDGQVRKHMKHSGYTNCNASDNHNFRLREAILTEQQPPDAEPPNVWGTWAVPPKMII
eukprot:4467852-Amphidinium_carterae.1